MKRGHRSRLAHRDARGRERPSKSCANGSPARICSHSSMRPGRWRRSSSSGRFTRHSSSTCLWLLGSIETTCRSFPAAIGRFSFDGFDAVRSFSHCAAKSVKTPPDVPHLCYCFTPMRYAWDQFDAYFGKDRLGTAGSARDAPDHAADGPVGPPNRRPSEPLSWLSHITLRAGSADTIIARQRCCIHPSRPSTPPRTRAPSEGHRANRVGARALQARSRLRSRRLRSAGECR